jgi:hypothetical protein
MTFSLMQKAYELEVYGPLIIVTMVRDATDEEFREYLDHLLATYEREPHYVSVVDPSPSPYLPTAQRHMMGTWLSAHNELLRRRCLGTAFIFTSPVSRFVLSSILLLRAPPYPYAVCTNRAEALAQAATWLRGAGIDPGPFVARANVGHERLGS